MVSRLQAIRLQALGCFRRALGLLLLIAGLSCAQSQFPLRFLAEFGDLGVDDPRKSVNLGLATLFAAGPHMMRVEGHDRTGGPWQVWLPFAGTTEVWSGDFDGNGRQDLLIGEPSSKSGRCAVPADMIVLLFDDQGRPVPWNMATNLPNADKPPHVPVLILDANRNGRAEFVMTDCEYADTAEHWGVDMRITGVYEARAGRMVPVKGAGLAPYEVAARAAYRTKDPEFVGWLSTNPDQWPDLMSGFNAPAELQLTALITPEAGCVGIRLPLVENGLLVDRVNDPCEVTKDPRATYSDGQTRIGWPGVVIDGPAGREVFVPENGDALRRVLRDNLRLKLLGPESNPAWLWAEAAASQPVELSSRLVTVVESRELLALGKQHGANGFDAVVSRGTRCFGFGWQKDTAEEKAVFTLDACPFPSRFNAPGSGQVRLRESLGWRLLPQMGAVRLFERKDGREFLTVVFQPPQGVQGEIAGALQLASDWLVEWRDGRSRWLTLYGEEGKPITGAMSTSIEGELFDGDEYSGIRFLQWVDERPAVLTTARAHVEWSRASPAPRQP